MLVVLVVAVMQCTTALLAQLVLPEPATNGFVIIGEPATAIAAVNGLAPTGLPTDLAIDGDGWFVVRDGATDVRYATRWGGFQIDSNGYFITSAGLRLQGFENASLTTLGDLRLKSQLSNPIRSFKVEADGKIWATLADGQQSVNGQVLLQDYCAPDKLVRVGHKFYRISPASLPQSVFAPGTGRLGRLLGGTLDVTPEPMRLTLERSADQAGPLARGALTQTWLPTDLGIVGDGFFLVRNTNTSELFATRVGMFLQDGDGYLITYDRLRVQGFTDAELSTRGDVRIDVADFSTGEDSKALVSAFSIGTDGKVRVRLTDGTECVRSQVLLYSFNHPERLAPTNRGLYRGVTQADPRILTLTGGVYEDGIRCGELELVNVTEDLLKHRQRLNLSTQGELIWTGSPTDLAMAGRGFFVLKDPASGIVGVTRAGGFQLDATGYLVTTRGWRVQGFSDTNLADRGDIRVDAVGRPGSSDPSAIMTEFRFDSDGKVQVRLSDGTEFVRAQILLQDFREPFSLTPSGYGIYTNLAPAGPLPLAAPPATANLGWVADGFREYSHAFPLLTLPSRKGVRLRVTGEPRGLWVFQASVDLIAWTTLAYRPNAPDEMEFSDPQSSEFPKRFYRVLVSPWDSALP